MLFFGVTTQTWALSPQAQGLIEEMRARIQQRAIEPTAAQDASEPAIGQELASALHRARVAVRSEQAALQIAQTNERHEPNVHEDIISYENYVPGEMLSQAMSRVRYIREQNCPVRFDPEAYVQPKEVAQKPALEEKVEKQEQKVTIAASSHETLNQSINNRREKMERQFRQLSNRSASSRTDTTSTTVAESRSADEESERFNKFISRYDFRMPDNYRIIVR